MITKVAESGFAVISGFTSRVTIIPVAHPERKKGSSPNRVGKTNADYAASACLAWVNGLLNAEKI